MLGDDYKTCQGNTTQMGENDSNISKILLLVSFESESWSLALREEQRLRQGRHVPCRGENINVNT
jgi:hypothetical protein